MKCKCGKTAFNPMGYATSKLGILVDAPLFEDMKTFKLLGGLVGLALQQELANEGIDMNSLYIQSMHLHLPSKDCEVQDNLADRLKHQKAVLVMGNHAFTALTGKKAGDNYGMVLKFAQIKPVLVAAPPVGMLVTGSLGEYRLAIKAFSNLMRRHK
jgi:hypothetical protein